MMWISVYPEVIHIINVYSLTLSLIIDGYCYRAFPMMCWFGSLPSAQQDCRSFFRVIYVGGPLKGPQLTTTADTLTPTRYSLLSSVSIS